MKCLEMPPWPLCFLLLESSGPQLAPTTLPSLSMGVQSTLPQIFPAVWSPA